MIIVVVVVVLLEVECDKKEKGKVASIFPFAFIVKGNQGLFKSLQLIIFQMIILLPYFLKHVVILVG